jgi:DNA-binding transcriptional ArsR family regulator
MSTVFKALADPTRRRVLQLLRQRAMTAGEIAEHFKVSKPTLSGHFAVLREADLIEAEKQGTKITYSLKLSVLEEAVAGLADALGLGLQKTKVKESKRWATARSQS